MQGRIIQLNVSKGGLPKFPVPSAYATPLGLEGDAHRNPLVHGGPQKALLLISSEDIATLCAAGFPVFSGALGENLTIEGLPFRDLRPGMRFRAGEAVIVLTRPRSPCANLDVYNSPELGRIQEAVYDTQVKAGDTSSPRWGVAGFYALVERPGLILSGDIINLLDQAV